MTALLFLWLALLIALVGLAIGRSREGGALTLAYFLSLSMIHVPGVLAYLYPDWDFLDPAPTELGFQITLIGLVAFVTGAVWARWSAKSGANPSVRWVPASAEVLNDFGWRMIQIGWIAYFVILPVSTLVPSSTAIVSSLTTTLMLGVWLRLYSAIERRDRRSALMTLAMLPMLPLATLVTGGFIGFGVNMALSIVAFLVVISRRRIWYYLGAPIAVILGLSLFVAYMGERSGIRDLVWDQKASYSDRFERMRQIITNFRLLDLRDPTHRAALDGRLNQNVLVGAGVMQYESGFVQLAYGSTLQLWAFVPRAIWPDKPGVGGGGSIVTDFTGIEFAEGTSVGAGQVLEFYYNFGLPGVVAGFLALGFILKRLDLGVMRAFATGDKRRILLMAMPGLTLLQPGGNLREITVAVVGALVAAYLVLQFERRTQSNQRARYVAVRARAGARSAVTAQNVQSQRPLS